jgi:succinate dehydrogenase/fumarate reductase flavoprotein subunit
VRAVARSGLARTESRGAHQRSDRPERDPELDGRHVVVAGAGDAAGTPPTGAGAAPGDDRIAWQSWS